MIGRGPLRVSHVLAVSVLTAGFVFAGFATRPSLALAAANAPAAASGQNVAYAIGFELNGTTSYVTSNSTTVGDFLRERNVVVGPNDYVDPSVDTPLSDGLAIAYRRAVPVTIEIGKRRIVVDSAAQDIGALLEEQHVRLGQFDEVKPSLADSVPKNGTVRVARVVTWERNQRHTIAVETIHRLDFTMSPGTSKVVSNGSSGVSEETIRFMQRDSGAVQRSVVASHVVRKAHPRIVSEGVDEYEAFARLAGRGVTQTQIIAATALSMVATAYTAGCYGCSGITATGRPAGHGVVAVDPGVIPLGTRLYIPGYGFAVAGDTGGAIHGYRIDLGFNSERDALLFGRRSITVYRLK